VGDDKLSDLWNSFSYDLEAIFTFCKHFKMQTFSNAIFVATFFILPIAPMRYMFFAISKFLVINFSKTEFKRMHNVT